MTQQERHVGRYKVQYVKFIEGQWRPYGPWMRVMVTDQRLIFIPDHAPQHAKQMVIYPQMIGRVWSVCLGKRDGGVIALNSGQLLYFYVHWSESARLIRDINHLLRPTGTRPVLATTAPKRLTN
jgi:hypothetical protein